jgi:hypothetical protein
MKMHQTTVRLPPALWASLEEEAARSGVSVAQFLRDSALARLMYLAGRRGNDVYDASLAAVAGDAADSAELERPRAASARPPRQSEDSQTLWAQSRRTRAQSGDRVEGSQALWAQSRQARKRALELRDEAERRRASVEESPNVRERAGELRGHAARLRDARPSADGAVAVSAAEDS